MTVEVLESFGDRQIWDEFIHRHPYGHFFQGWAWGDLQDALGGRPVRLAVIDDGRVRGCLQALLFESTSRRFAYVPRGPVADPLDWPAIDGLLERLRSVCVRHAVALVRVEPQWPFDEHLVRTFEDRGFTRARQFIMPRRTLLVQLEPSMDAVWHRFHSNTRNRIRLATKRGIDVRVAGPADMPTFIRLFEETVSRHGLRRASVEAFDLAARHFGGRDDMRLYLASHEGTDLAGIVVFVSGRTATYLWGASAGAAEARRLNPNQLLHWHAMQWASERGCTTYDLFGIPDHDLDVLEAEYGRQTGGMWNLYRFKRGFGGTVHRQLGTFDVQLEL